MNDHELLQRYGHLLTDKEREAFNLSARGMGTRSIALALGIKRSAVRSRLENAKHKLDHALRNEEAA